MTISSRWPYIAGVVLLCALSFLYQRRSQPISRLTMATAQIVAFPQVSAILSYGAMAASPFPLADDLLAHADATIGFDWVTWNSFVDAHPVFRIILIIAYFSFVLQIPALVIYFSFKNPRRVHEFLMASMLAVAICIAVMTVLPALGASHHPDGTVEDWARDIIALRERTMHQIGTPDGIIFCPSFHTVMGLLFIQMARGRTFMAPVVLLNGLLIVSVPTVGSHYLVDVFAGALVAILSHVWARSLLRWGAGVRPVAMVAAA